MDPAAALDQVGDVLVRDGHIEAVGSELSDPQAEVIDCFGRLVLPGLIDTHAHVYQHVTGRFGLNPDLCGVNSGVTTLIDQGGASCMTLPGFRMTHGQNSVQFYSEACRFAISCTVFSSYKKATP